MTVPDYPRQFPDYPRQFQNNYEYYKPFWI